MNVSMRPSLSYQSYAKARFGHQHGENKTQKAGHAHQAEAPHEHHAPPKQTVKKADKKEFFLIRWVKDIGAWLKTFFQTMGHNIQEILGMKPKATSAKKGHYHADGTYCEHEH